MPDSSGMHKCDDLPVYEEQHLECFASLETGLHNETDCINWNQVFENRKIILN